MNETSEEHPRAEGEDPGKEQAGLEICWKGRDRHPLGADDTGDQGPGRGEDAAGEWAPPQLTPQVPRDQGGRTQEGVPLLPAASVTPAPPSDGAGPRSEGDNVYRIP